MGVSFVNLTSLFRSLPMNVTVYTLPACAQCDTTKRYLNNQLIEFEEVNIAEDTAAYEAVREMGFTSAPVVSVTAEDGTTQSWSGFRLEALQKLSLTLKQESTPAAA